MQQSGILFVLSGPSGAGKGTICQELLRQIPNLQYSVSATTRKPRLGETNGINYWFKEKDEFEEMIKNDLLLEYAEVYGNYYGTPKEQVLKVLKSGKNVVLEIDPQGAMQVKAKFPEGVFIYILPPSLDELAARITKRGTDSKDSIKKRLAAATEEIQYALKYDYVVVNDKVETAVDSIATIISAEKFNSKRRKKIILNICESEKLKHD
ncbi:MAG: guanylate kinase [Negativicutes bacterium]|jgi:guanylate kinase|nr:guanylate kinase [Negativicutes bacterium]MBP9537020.1 guanylate kinase [Negativicutes bacterium]